MTKTFEEVPVATVEVIPTFDGNEIKFKPSSKLENYLIAEGEVELYLRTQHQPLPVVPEFVGEWLEHCQKNKKSLSYALHDMFLRDFLLERFGDDDSRVRWLSNSSNQDSLARAWLDGYTVEKQQQKRYEVKLLSGESMHFNPIGNPKNIKDYRFSFGNYAGWKTKFTKSELGKIMGGAIYKGCILPDGHEFSSDCKPWINPLIELVPVEDGE
ncbi:DUF1642 domain-containing protein [Lactococcus taiwanensis]|uniref:DUF1642 domain-containing protein n=1 Tax=Lactococcus taiwanensis TaxID=1151742 RepID=UPI0028974E67|nr:DUF1642 domain-containing protein [Lactococcus taiwanensis]